jgi:hypothetical protein
MYFRHAPEAALLFARHLSGAVPPDVSSCWRAADRNRGTSKAVVPKQAAPAFALWQLTEVKAEASAGD